MYDLFKDSIYNLEKNKQITEIETRYDSKSKDKKIKAQASTIEFYAIRNKIIITILILVLILSVGYGIRFVNKQKKYQVEKAYIEAQYKTVANKNLELTEKLREVSQKIKVEKIPLTKVSNLNKYKKSSLSEEQRIIYMDRILEVLNISFGKNFYRFINLYRVEEAKKILENDRENLTMLAVAFDCGFNSKTSFNRVFKEIVGSTPTQFKGKLKKVS